MRGKELECRCVRLPERITPAYAGKSHKVRLQAAGRWDHPRVCGEKCAWPPGCGSLTGSPPRMRGKGCDACTRSVYDGITPACAGKSKAGRLFKIMAWDHPRMCGEKSAPRITSPVSWGSPPHVRGKDSTKNKMEQTDRITPACAGKRFYSLSVSGIHWDHPRMCGEKTKKIP